MLRSTWHFLKFAFHTAVVLVSAVVKAPPPLQRTFVILFAFVQLRAALGVAGVHHHMYKLQSHDVCYPMTDHLINFKEARWSTN